jgi:hypothetical protein
MLQSRFPMHVGLCSCCVYNVVPYLTHLVTPLFQPCRRKTYGLWWKEEALTLTGGEGRACRVLDQTGRAYCMASPVI